jgi:hypothetical protein
MKNTITQKTIIFDWECPPRFIDKYGEKEFVSFDVDLKTIFKSKKIDEFTEIPRAISNKTMEIQNLEILARENKNIEFYKFIADTNIELVKNKNVIADNNSIEKFYEFKKLLENETKNYPVKTSIILFSDFLKKKRLYLKYKNIYKTWLVKINQDSSFKKLLNQQIRRTNEHMGIKNQIFAKQIAAKTIASYAAEGAIFELLQARQENYIWFNTSENDKRTIKITNLARIKKMPMIFPQNVCPKTQ